MVSNTLGRRLSALRTLAVAKQAVASWGNFDRVCPFNKAVPLA